MAWSEVAIYTRVAYILERYFLCAGQTGNLLLEVFASFQLSV